ncbi:uncharacterized protein LOC143473185 [Clavelina lepadiformis]|uniref:Uncharacterized protein n=1 Tax=Clavelina lepadiformis TaxID=159417 RepID=A0ABP0FW79_CLALP
MNRSQNNSYAGLVDERRATAFIVIETIFLVCDIYLILALLYYAATKLATSLQGVGSRTMERRKLILFVLVVYFALTSVGKFALAQWIYYISPEVVTKRYCATFSLVFQVFNTTGLISLYSFLWLRQYTLYLEPHLRHYSTVCIIRFSRVLLAVIIIIGTASLIGVILSNREENFSVIEGSNACLLTTESTLNSVVIYTGYSVIIILQACILSLFVHILRKYQASMRVNLEGSGSSMDERIHRLVRNCTIAAAISAVSDVTAIILRMILRGNIAEFTIFTIWDIDAFINLTCTILCFSNWKEILWPWPDRTEKGAEQAQISRISGATVSTNT